jgi:replicative DNA helicase
MTQAPRAAERMLPQNIEAECGLLGSIIIDPEALALVADFLRAEDFYRDAHRSIYEVMLHLYNQRTSADFITICDILESRGKLEEVGGASYITSLINQVPTSGNVLFYARIVERTATLRNLIGAVGQIAAMVYEAEDDAAPIVERAEQLIFAISQHSLSLGTDASLAELLTSYMDRLDQLSQRRGSVVGVPTGFAELDRMTGGLRRSDLIVLAARPSIGKTSLALSLACQAALHFGQHIGIFSLEMSQEQLTERLMAMETGINLQRLSTGNIEDDEWDTIVAALGRLSAAQIRIDGTSVLSPVQMRSRARRWVVEYGLDLIIVDYLQLMQPSDISSKRKLENRVQVVDEISRNLKLLARELNIPILVLAQLSRAVESRLSKVPQLSDLRECVIGDTRLVDATTGRWVSIRTVREGMQILGVDSHQRIRPFAVEHVWSTGVKLTYLLTTRTGRQVQATANHPFLTPQGWKCLEQLQAGDLIATALRLPEHGAELEERTERCRLLGYLVGDGTYQRHREVGFISMDGATMQDACEIVSHNFAGVLARDKPCHNSQAKQAVFTAVYANGYGKPYGNPLREWLRSLGVFGQRDNTKHVPAYVFEAGVVGAREFLAGYLATDGGVKQRRSGSHKGMWEIQFDTVSHTLALDVQALLLRLGIVSSVQPGRYDPESTQPIYRVEVALTTENLRRCTQIPVRGKKGELLRQMEATLVRDHTNSGIFGLPKEVSAMVAGRSRRRVSVPRGMWTGRTWHDQGKRVNREVCWKWALEMEDTELSDWASSDLLWEPIRNIVPAGEAEVFDITVPGCANFLANGIVAHNSGGIEQNADIVMFIYRDEVYNPDTQRRGIADIIVAKHRNGPTGTFCLRFEPQTTHFRDLTDEVVAPLAPDELEIEMDESEDY